jgi:MOSC domain-containing protein YiiM
MPSIPKLNIRFGIDGMALRVQETGRTGWYYRVLEPGKVTQGDIFDLTDRPQPDWPLSRMIHYLFAEPLEYDMLEDLAGITELSPNWQQLFQRRIDSEAVEEWKYRLTVP